MNTEQIKKEFEAWAIKRFGEFQQFSLERCKEEGVYVYQYVEDAWETYQAAAKSRDELIGKLVDGVNKIYTYPDCIKQALAEAKAQGYGE